MATATASPPAALISETNDSRRSTRRAATTTLAPLAANILAKCTPNPLDAPVTIATLPLTSNSEVIFTILN